MNSGAVSNNFRFFFAVEEKSSQFKKKAYLVGFIVSAFLGAAAGGIALAVSVAAFSALKIGVIVTAVSAIVLNFYVWKYIPTSECTRVLLPKNGLTQEQIEGLKNPDQQSAFLTDLENQLKLKDSAVEWFNNVKNQLVLLNDTNFLYRIWKLVESSQCRFQMDLTSIRCKIFDRAKFHEIIKVHQEDLTFLVDFWCSLFPDASTDPALQQVFFEKIKNKHLKVFIEGLKQKSWASSVFIRHHLDMRWLNLGFTNFNIEEHGISTSRTLDNFFPEEFFIKLDIILDAYQIKSEELLKDFENRSGENFILTLNTVRNIFRTGTLKEQLSAVEKFFNGGRINRYLIAQTVNMFLAKYSRQEHISKIFSTLQATQDSKICQSFVQECFDLLDGHSKDDLEKMQQISNSFCSSGGLLQFGEEIVEFRSTKALEIFLDTMIAFTRDQKKKASWNVLMLMARNNHLPRDEIKKIIVNRPNVMSKTDLIEYFGSTQAATIIEGWKERTKLTTSIVSPNVELSEIAKIITDYDSALL